MPNTPHKPRHVAIIMDGNGRWAKKRHIPRALGHKRGVETVRDIVRAAGDLGLEVLSLYAFSSENWKRPEDEINDLMGLLRSFIKSDIDEFAANDVRFARIEALVNEWQPVLLLVGLPLALDGSEHGMTVLARAVIHTQLDDPETLRVGEDRDEAVHLAVERERLGEFPTHGAEGAAHVLDRHARHLADQPVAREARQLADEQLVLALGPQAEHGVVPLGELLEQHGDVRRVVLHVAVHRDDHVAGGPVDARAEGRRLAVVTA